MLDTFTAAQSLKRQEERSNNTKKGEPAPETPLSTPTLLTNSAEQAFHRPHSPFHLFRFDSTPCPCPTLTATSEKPTPEAKEEKGLPKRVLVFHGGLLDGDNTHPNEMAKVWKANGVKDEQIIIMPNCYPCEREVRQIEPLPPVKPLEVPIEERAQTRLGRLKQGAKNLAKQAGQLSKKVATATVNTGIKGLNFVQEKAAYVHGVTHCVNKYDDFNDPNSQHSKERIETLNRLLRTRGYSPENPAEISFIGHSGAISPGRRLAVASHDSNQKNCFKLVEFTSIGSPGTEKIFVDLPPQVEVNYVVSGRDTLHKRVTLVSKFLNLFNFKSLFGGKPSQVGIVDNVKPYLQSDDKIYRTDTEGHREGYYRDVELLRKLIPDTLQRGNGRPLKQVSLP